MHEDGEGEAAGEREAKAADPGGKPRSPEKQGSSKGKRSAKTTRIDDILSKERKEAEGSRRRRGDSGSVKSDKYRKSQNLQVKSNCDIAETEVEGTGRDDVNAANVKSQIGQSMKSRNEGLRH